VVASARAYVPGVQATGEALVLLHELPAGHFVQMVDLAKLYSPDEQAIGVRL